MRMSERWPGASAALEALAMRWRAEATVLRQRAAVPQAEALESVAAELEVALALSQEATVSLQEAARLSGYTPDALTRLVRRGILRNVGRTRSPRFRIADLPRKAAPLRTPTARPSIASARQGAGSVIAKERN